VGSEKTIEDKFYFWLNNITGVGFRDSHIPLLEIGFEVGYNLSKEELKQQILDAENVIRELTEHSLDEEISKAYWEKYERNNN
jgi:hypothetical protein